MMKIIDRNIADQTRGIFRSPSVIPTHAGIQSDSHPANEWREILPEQGSRQVLSDAEILELSALVVKIEEHYGFPCDIEWARENGQFYIVQSRPITTLASSQKINADDAVLHVDWERSIERKQAFLLASIFLDIYATSLREVTGAVFIHQMVVYQKGFALYLRSAQEIAVALSGPLLELAGNSAKVAHLVDVGLQTPKQAEELVEKIKKSLLVDDIKDFEVLYATYKEVLLYQILVPYWILGAINLLEVEQRAKYNTTIQLLEPFRAMGDAKLLEEQFLMPILAFLSRKTGIPLERLAYLSAQEFVLLMAGDVPRELAKILEERENAAFVAWIDEQGDDQFDFSGRYLSIGSHFENGKDGVWHGKTAFPGKIQGVVRIVESLKDKDKFSEGDILVSISTNPTLITMLGLASAIVSDEGGIMSHAAIISREMKKPCVVGVENASKLLHDGDLVEVDADNGVVRVLERAESRV